MSGVDKQEVTRVVNDVICLLAEHYVDPDAVPVISQALAASLAQDHYPADEKSLADAVTADLQSVNGDRHLRLLYHAEPLPERTPGDDTVEHEALARWASQTCYGIARVELLPGNVGYLDIQPVLFPAAISGDAIAAAMTLVEPAEALLIDVRHCLGGDPETVALLCSYLLGPEPVELTGLQERRGNRVRQYWTTPFVPGRRFGAAKPVCVLTSRDSFSGAEQLAYDLQQLGRATIVGERTKGGAHAREGFRVHPHLEATISVARGVSPVTGGNWEGTGVTPDIDAPAGHALDRAHRHAVEVLAAVVSGQAQAQ
jgi:hypothetical protein